MTHEPECDAATLSIKGHEFNLPCICEVARYAYQRGREDAAKGLTNWYLANGDEPLSEWESECITAARGEDKNV